MRAYLYNKIIAWHYRAKRILGRERSLAIARLITRLLEVTVGREHYNGGK